jgi:hypothetical protein
MVARPPWPDVDGGGSFAADPPSRLGALRAGEGLSPEEPRVRVAGGEGARPRDPSASPKSELGAQDFGIPADCQASAPGEQPRVLARASIRCYGEAHDSAGSFLPIPSPHRHGRVRRSE